MSDLPRAFGPAVLGAQLRTQAEDFQVVELPSFAASGDGEHLLLTVRKRGHNTVQLAKWLAQWAGVGEQAVSYAGQKDRHAVTEQRFSIHLPGQPDPDLASLAIEGVEVVRSERHNRKLQRGALAGNRFTLVLRQVVGERAAIEARLSQIAARGLPNWFGEQRFGHGGSNIGQALAMFAGRRVRRDQRSMLLSAARSQLFNQVLGARVLAGNWDSALQGEVWLLNGSRSVFGPEDFTPELARRLADFDIHPSAPLWGEGELRSTGAARALEEAAVSDDIALRLRAGLEKAELRQERRALRLKPDGLGWQWLDEDVLQLRFALPPGCYATALVHELGEVSDASQLARSAGPVPAEGTAAAD